jgi:hypothetical protein
MQKYPTPEEIKQMTTEDLQAASAAALRDRDELWERGDEDGAWNMQATVIQDIAIEIMLRKDPLTEDPLPSWWASQQKHWEEPWLLPPRRFYGSPTGFQGSARRSSLPAHGSARTRDPRARRPRRCRAGRQADDLVDEAKAAGGGDHPVTVHAKMLRLELLKVKADLERELETWVPNCTRCGLDVHWVSGIGVSPGHWAHREPAPHGEPAV